MNECVGWIGPVQIATLGMAWHAVDENPWAQMPSLSDALHLIGQLLLQIVWYGATPYGRARINNTGQACHRPGV